MSFAIYPRGVIYDSRKSFRRGEFFLRAGRVTRFLYGLLRGIGAGLIGFAVISFLVYFYPVVREEGRYRLGQKKTVVSRVHFGDLLNIVEAEKISQVQQEAKSLGLNPGFSLYVEKIGAAANVISNVDAANEEEYLDALRSGVAHAKGTYFPGQGKTIFLFAHSTNAPFNISRYNAVFYLLKELKAGDRVVVFFADKKYLYQVEEKLVVPAEDTSWLSEMGKERLILQTCYPPGTTWKRLLVIAKPITI